MNSRLHNRVAKLEQTRHGSMIPTLTVTIHRNGCRADGACDARCRRLINGIYTEREGTWKYGEDRPPAPNICA